MACLNRNWLFLCCFLLIWTAILPLPADVLAFEGHADHDSYYENRPPVTEELIEQIRVWRNWFGRPYSAAVYEKGFSIASTHLFQLRSDLAWDLMTEDVYQAFQSFADRQEVPERFDCNTPNQKWVGNYGRYSEEDNAKCRQATWFRMNVSEVGGGFLWAVIAECFAWYTGPDYQQGMLPEELERALEDMVQGRATGKSFRFPVRNDLWYKQVVPEAVGILYLLRREKKFREQHIPKEPKSAGWVTSFAHMLNAIKDAKKAGVWPE